MVYVGLGSNLGDRAANIEAAIEHLKKIEGLRIKKVSSLYETEPVGGPPQGKFLNGVVCVETSLSPWELLGELKVVEGRLGRKSTVPDGPRTIDLDILLYRDLVVETEDLKIPHPRMDQRRFVLEPLAEIAPEVVHPRLKKKVSHMLEEITQNEQCRKWVI